MRILKKFSNKIIQIENWKNKGRACRISVYHTESGKTDFFYLNHQELICLINHQELVCLPSNKYPRKLFSGNLQFTTSLRFIGRFYPNPDSNTKSYWIAFFNLGKKRFHFVILHVDQMVQKFTFWFFSALKKISEAENIFLLSAETRRRNFGRRNQIGNPDELAP